MKLPLVTIVTPSLNQGAFLENNILSIIGQDYPNIEHIIIDGLSSDNSIDIIKKYSDHMTYWVTELDTGQSNAINKGFFKGKGSIVAWLNADDMLMPSTVKTAVYYLLKYPQYGLIYGDRVHIDSRGDVIGFRRCPSHRNSMFKKNFTIPQETAFFRCEVYEAAGRLDENLSFAMDFDLWCKMTEITNMYHVPAFLGYYREHLDAKSIQFHSESGDTDSYYHEEHKEVYRKHFKKSLPSILEMKWNRLERTFRLIIEQRSNRYRRLKKLIHKVTEFNIKPETTVDDFINLGDGVEV